jgi:hypothetical protein
MAKAITAETLLDKMTTLSEAKEMARFMRETTLAVERAGKDASSMSKRYDDFIDEMAYRYSIGRLV